MRLNLMTTLSSSLFYHRTARGVGPMAHQDNRIIFESGYLCNNRVFMENFSAILTMAILGTVFNTFAIGETTMKLDLGSEVSGYTMYGVGLALDIEGFRPIDGLVFGSLIAAVDPVAVLAVFEEVLEQTEISSLPCQMHVNDRLHVIVFGESLLNDGVAVVLYRICVSLAYEKSIDVSSTGTRSLRCTTQP